MQVAPMSMHTARSLDPFAEVGQSGADLSQSKGELDLDEDRNVLTEPFPR